MNRHLNVKGVIFDLDGTLVSSTLNFPLLRSLIGCPDQEDLLRFIDQINDVDQQQQAHDVVKQHEMDDAQRSDWLPGAQALVLQLNQQQIPLAIVTRNFSTAAQMKVRKNNMPIDIVITREDAPAKPDPTALLNIASEWEIQPQELMYVGDFRYDVEAANNAEMISCLYAPAEQPDYAHTADLVITHFDQLAEILRG